MKKALHIISSLNGVEVDHSKEARDFKRDTFSVDLGATNPDFIYIGYNKVINAVYVMLEQENTVTSSLSLEYYSESGWTALGACDDTNAFTRSGFITWDRPDNAAELTVAGKTACWVRLSADDDIDATTFQAINLVFSDDNDLCEVVPGLIDPCFYPSSGPQSHILQHVAAKNYIMQRLRQVGYIKNTADGEENINEWDILDITELRQASVFYAISQVYFNLSDDPEDQYWAKYREYEQKFEEAFALGRLRIDLDDDGQVDEVEKRPRNSIRWVK